MFKDHNCMQYGKQYKMIQRRTKKLANRIFQTLEDGCPLLTAIVICNGKADTNSILRRGYLRGRGTDRQGVEKAIGRTVSPGVVRYHQSASSILDEDLGKFHPVQRGVEIVYR